MKKLLCILILALSISTFAQKNTDTIVVIKQSQLDAINESIAKLKKESGDAISTAIPDSSEITFSKVYSDVKGGLSGLAGALKVGAEHVYVILVKQQIVMSVTNLIVLILGFIFLMVFVRKYKDDKEEWGTGEGPTGLGIYRFFQLLAGFAMALVGLMNLDKIISGFINPEYGAIQDIINFVK